MDNRFTLDHGHLMFTLSKSGEYVTIRHALQPGEHITVDVDDFLAAVSKLADARKVLYNSTN
jgi:hypothetical protein